MLNSFYAYQLKKKGMEKQYAFLWDMLVAQLSVLNRIIKKRGGFIMKGNKSLSEIEKSRPYSKDYYLETGPYDEEAYAKYRQNIKIDPESAMTIQRVSDLLNSGYLADEYGWCNIPDGTGYVACKIRMPDVEPEMLPWFLGWTALEDFRYKIWWPETHFAVRVEPETRRRLLDLKEGSPAP
jgi:hypothetical protein